MAKLQIHDKEFASKKEAKDFFRALFMGYIGKTIPSSEPIFPLVMALLNRHPSADEKIGTGVIGFKVIENYMQKGTPEIWVLRSDLTQIDFSWNKCVVGADITDRALLNKAMRVAITPQIMVFRKTPPTVCPICKCDLSQVPFHIDHVIPFKALTSEFLASWSKPLPTKFSDTNSFNSTDREFEFAWQNHHLKHATFQYLCATCNLTKK